jgi:hypothetical protein
MLGKTLNCNVNFRKFPEIFRKVRKIRFRKFPEKLQSEIAGNFLVHYTNSLFIWHDILSV